MATTITIFHHIELCCATCFERVLVQPPHSITMIVKQTTCPCVPCVANQSQPSSISLYCLLLISFYTCLGHLISMKNQCRTNRSPVIRPEMDNNNFWWWCKDTFAKGMFYRNMPRFNWGMATAVVTQNNNTINHDDDVVAGWCNFVCLPFYGYMDPHPFCQRKHQMLQIYCRSRGP